MIGKQCRYEHMAATSQLVLRSRNFSQVKPCESREERRPCNDERDVHVLQNNPRAESYKE